MTELLVAPCDHDAAKYAVLHWHYSRRMPAGKLVKFGVWESGEFIGAVVYGRGANHNLGAGFGLAQDQVCELVRVALREHAAPVTQVVAASLRELRRGNPGLRLVISYADPEHGHHGGIYQAGSWLYLGPSDAQAALLVDGVPMHKRTASANYGTASPELLRDMLKVPVEWAPVRWKHRYVMPLDRGMRRQLERLARPYPPAQ